jgi:isoprenylcysteine carboxyl methyltransferase (ICMT) family protein YpbQ
MDAALQKRRRLENDLRNALRKNQLSRLSAPVRSGERQGRFWTHRIIKLADAPIARSGPCRYLSHPNYAVTIVETFVLPLAFGAIALAVIMTALWWIVINTKMKLEDEALASRR